MGGGRRAAELHDGESNRWQEPGDQYEANLMVFVVADAKNRSKRAEDKFVSGSKMGGVAVQPEAEASGDYTVRLPAS